MKYQYAGFENNLGWGRKSLLQRVNRAGSFRVKAERLMGPAVTEERPKANVTANQSVFTHHVYIMSDTSGHGESLFAGYPYGRETRVALHRPQQPPPPNGLTALSILALQDRRLKCNIVVALTENVLLFKMMFFYKTYRPICHSICLHRTACTLKGARAKR